MSGCPICPGCEGIYPGPPRSGVTLHPEAAMQAEKRYYTTADRSRLVEEGDPDAAYLLAAEGANLSVADIERYGIGKKAMPEPEPMVVHSIAADPPKDEEPAPAEDDAPQAKAVSAPPETKARSRKDAEDK